MTLKPPRIRTLVAAIALLALLPPSVPAQEAWAQPGAADVPRFDQNVPTAPIAIDGVVLFRVRGVSSYPAEERAKAIAGRIRAIAADRTIQPDALRIEEREGASEILTDRQSVMSVFDADAQVEGVPRKLVATLYLGRIKQAVVSYRTDRSWPALQQAAISALVATLIFAALAAAVIWLRRMLHALIDRRFRRRVESLAAKSHEVVSVNRLWGVVDTALRLARTGTIVVLALMYLEYLFGLFPYTRPAAHRVVGYVVGPLATMWASFLSTIPDLIFLVILAFVVRIVLRLIRRFFEAVDEGRIHLANFDRDWARPTYRLVRPAVIAFAVVVGYPYIPGSGSEAFKGVSILVGIVFSLGSSSFIANMIAGYSMTYRRAFRVGDLVQIGDVTGVVSDVRLQVTHMRTIKNEEVVLPNSQILNTHVTNYSTLAQTKGLILHTTVGIGYETPWRQVEAMLLEAARRTPGLMADPPPFVFHLLLGDFCVTYELNVYCNDALKMKATYTDLHRHILDVFNEYGVQIMTPAYEGDPDVAKVVPKDQWYLAPAKPGEPPG
jgi:small-conductance mechanosensitive channel